MVVQARRDTPAARAALARRRQRAAQMVNQSGGDSNTTKVKPFLQVDTSAVIMAKPPIKEVISSPSRRPPTSGRGSPTKLLRPSSSTRGRQASSENSNSNSNSASNNSFSTSSKKQQQYQQQRHISPLARRAHQAKVAAQQQKSSSSSPTGNTTIDGTLTTAALSISTYGKSSYSPDNLNHDSHNNNNNNNKSSFTGSTGTEAARQAKQVAESASSILNARTKYRSSSPKNSIAPSSVVVHASSDTGSLVVDNMNNNANTNGTPTTTTTAHTETASSSLSRFQRDADLLAASKRRRATLESRHRFHVANRATQPSPPRQIVSGNTVAHNIGIGIGIAANPKQQQQQQQKLLGNVKVSPSKRTSPSPPRRRPTTEPQKRPAAAINSSKLDSSSPATATTQRPTISSSPATNYVVAHAARPNSQPKNTSLLAASAARSKSTGYAARPSNISNKLNASSSSSPSAIAAAARSKSTGYAARPSRQKTSSSPAVATATATRPTSTGYVARPSSQNNSSSRLTSTGYAARSSTQQDSSSRPNSKSLSNPNNASNKPLSPDDKMSVRRKKMEESERQQRQHHHQQQQREAEQRQRQQQEEQLREKQKRQQQQEEQRDSPLLARGEKLEQQQQQQQQTKQTSSPTRPSPVIPRRKTSPGKTSPRRNLSPRRFHNSSGLPPPSPRSSRKQSSAAQTTHAFETVESMPSESKPSTRPREGSASPYRKSRSPSPSRRKTTSPWLEKNANRQRPRPMPIKTTTSSDMDEHEHEHEHEHEYGSEQSNNNNTSGYAQRGRNASPRRPEPASYGVQSGASPRSGRNSPGVERLSSFLMDSSSIADVSTIADMTLHQMDPPFQSLPYTTPQKLTRAKPNVIEADEGMIDDQATIDDDKLQNIDSACLYSGTSILLRAYSLNATIAAQPHTDGKYYVAEACGICLGKEEEIFRIKQVSGDGSELRHGDTVMLHSAMAKNYTLGARKLISSDGMMSKMELGFFSVGTSKSETWEILSGKSDREVLVGRAAVANKDSRNSGGAPAPVRSGDAILLRNCHNGGILSINAKEELILLTDSYDHKQTNDDPSLLGRLQHHDRLYPTRKEMFQLLLSSTPPCPQWVSGRSINERIFLTGSYILQPRRNQRSAQFESNLFSGSNEASTLSLLDASKRYVPSDANLSPQTKEKIIIDEVIGSFLGLEGLHIRMKGSKGHMSSVDNYEFQLFDADGVSFDVSLRHLVEQILPLSTSYVRVRNFVYSRHPGYEHGRVMQALCEALDELLQDYVNFVAQLERELRKYSKHEPLTMKSIYFQITPSLHSMSILEHATRIVCEKKGGALINALWSLDKRVYMGDVVAKKVLGILLEKASVPYMDMMSGWLQSGNLRDPYEEFMVERSPDSKPQTQTADFDGDSWMTLFSINESHVLEGIVSNEWTKQKILTTGKYWNAVNTCHVDLKELRGPIGRPKIPKLPFNSDSSAIAAYIDSMYQSASRVLLRLMMDNFKLMESLQIMKRYFLIDQSDFLTHFLDASEQELAKHHEEVSIGRVQHWLTTSVQLTESHRDEVDPISGAISRNSTGPLVPTGLRCRFSDESLVDYLDSLYGERATEEPRTPSRHAYGGASKGNTGIEVFSIDLPRIPFPTSLVLSQQAVGNYKLLFRHLFFTKHVERRLIAVWRDHQLLKKLDSLRGLLGPTFLLRQRMLHFVQNLIYYMVFEVIEGNWMEMQSSIDTSIDTGPKFPSHRPQTVDDILNVHNAFLQKTLEACLLTNRGLIRSLTKLLNTCLLFTDQMKRFMDSTKIHDESSNLAAEKRGAVQKNLNERGGVSQPGTVDKKRLKRALTTMREERAANYQRETRRVGREVASESYKRMIGRFDEVFNADLADFMLQLNSHTATGVVANLGIRLDYNGYVTASIAMNVTAAVTSR